MNEDFSRLYCENMFWLRPDQPFNVYSNLAYLIAAIFIIRRRHELPKGPVWAIVLMLILMGASSAVWHWTMMSLALHVDLGVAALFGAVMAFMIARYVFYWPLWLCVPAVAVLLGLGVLVPSAPQTMWIARDSLVILPCSALLLCIGIWSAIVRRSNTGLYILMASFWLAGGFLVLSLDHPACHIFIYGTHFLWHVLAAMVVYCLARALASADIELLDDHWVHPPMASVGDAIPLQDNEKNAFEVP